MPKKEFFLKAIRLMRRGICPWCYEKRLHKSGIASYCCPHCDVTVIIEKDYVIFEWYVIKHGRRILRSIKRDANSTRWEELINYLKKRQK